MCIITAGKRDWKLLHNRIGGEKKMNNQIVDELQIASALIQTVADAVANRFGAKDTEHLDICLSIAAEKLDQCIQQLENGERDVE